MPHPSDSSGKLLKLLRVLETKAALGNTVKLNGYVEATLIGSNDSDLTPPDTPQPLTGGVYNNYVKITGLETISQGGYLSINDSQVVVGTGGTGEYYTSHAWVDMTGDTTNVTIGLIFAIERNGEYLFSQRPTGHKTKFSGSVFNISGGGFLSLVEGDKLSMWISADKSIVLSIHDMNIGFKMSM